MGHLGMKRKKVELQIEREQEGQRIAAQERALVFKQRMQEQGFAHKERMAPYELEIARLNGGQTSSANPVSLGQSQTCHAR